VPEGLRLPGLGFWAAQHGLRNPVERENFVGGVEEDRFARHAEDHAGCFVLGDGESVGPLHFQKAVRAVVSHARQQNPHGVGASGLRHGTEQHVDAGAMAGDERVTYARSRFTAITLCARLS
jgi:hypothetical protein